MESKGRYAQVPIQEIENQNRKKDDEANEIALEPAITNGRGRKSFVILVTICFIFISFTVAYVAQRYVKSQDIGVHKTVHSSWITPSQNSKKKNEPFPSELLGSIYNESDFRNEEGNVPPYWKNYFEYNASSNNSNGSFEIDTWGPCYPPNSKQGRIKWDEIELGPSSTIEYPDSLMQPKNDHGVRGLNNMCKPGFLIIGAGKCGTSSLYHYLIGHPRVLPASEKQIHYFKYYAERDLAWYYKHFPTTKSFLSSGGLMTGEAAPGYIPYPSVAHLVKVRMPGPKILTIAREPLDRAWSSYNYNYVRDALKIIKRKGAHKGYPVGESDEYYKEHHVFQFEDFIRTELALLKKCLEPGGKAEIDAKEKYYKWFRKEFERRDEEGLPPMVDVIGSCYPQPKFRNYPREQWSEMIKENPQREIGTPNLHLVEAFIGRGMYAAQVEWWYAAHPEEDNYLVCSEDLKEVPATTMLNVSKFLGLPDFDFTNVVGEGMFNVAGHKGYDKVTSWEEVEKEEESESSEIQISDDLRMELLEFLQTHNERLFALVGKRCSWEYST